MAYAHSSDVKAERGRSCLEGGGIVASGVWQSRADVRQHDLLLYEQHGCTNSAAVRTGWQPVWVASLQIQGCHHERDTWASLRRSLSNCGYLSRPDLQSISSTASEASICSLLVSTSVKHHSLYHPHASIRSALWAQHRSTTAVRAYRVHCSEVRARAKLCASTLPFDSSFGVMREYTSERLEDPVRYCVQTYLLARVCCMPALAACCMSEPA